MTKVKIKLKKGKNKRLLLIPRDSTVDKTFVSAPNMVPQTLPGVSPEHYLAWPENKNRTNGFAF